MTLSDNAILTMELTDNGHTVRIRVPIVQLEKHSCDLGASLVSRVRELQSCFLFDAEVISPDNNRGVEKP